MCAVSAASSCESTGNLRFRDRGRNDCAFKADLCMSRTAHSYGIGHENVLHIEEPSARTTSPANPWPLGMWLLPDSQLPRTPLLRSDSADYSTKASLQHQTRAADVARYTDVHN
jgi:hypothetical protein